MHVGNMRLGKQNSVLQKKEAKRGESRKDPLNPSYKRTVIGFLFENLTSSFSHRKQCCQSKSFRKTGSIAIFEPFKIRPLILRIFISTVKSFLLLMMRGQMLRGGISPLALPVGRHCMKLYCAGKKPCFAYIMGVLGPCGLRPSRGISPKYTNAN